MKIEHEMSENESENIASVMTESADTKVERAVDMVAEQLATVETADTKGKTKKAKSTSGSKKKKQKNISDAVVHVRATFNNTIITITDHSGNTLSWATAGKKFSGSRKSTPYAAQVAGSEALENALIVSPPLRNVEIIVRGPGPGREAAVRVFADHAQIKVKSIRDDTPIPHNGCRPPKRRRV